MTYKKSLLTKIFLYGLISVAAILGGGWYYCHYINKPSPQIVNLESELSNARYLIQEYQCIIDEQSCDIIRYRKNISRALATNHSKSKREKYLIAKIDSLIKTIQDVQYDRNNIKALDAYELNNYWIHEYSDS